jgi:hypothetical protein
MPARRFLATLATLLAACHHMAGTPPQRDVATVESSAHGLDHVAVRPAVAPIPVHRPQGWTLHVETAEGRSVDVATITTKPRVTRSLGGWGHLVDSMTFNIRL